jgi:hypothetical protein
LSLNDRLTASLERPSLSDANSLAVTPTRLQRYLPIIKSLSDPNEFSRTQPIRWARPLNIGLHEPTFVTWVAVKRSFFTKLELRGTFGSDMDIPMAYTAERDEIFFNIPSQLAARLDVMNLKIFRTTALLASPTVTAEQFLAELTISIPVQAKSGSSGHGPSHDAFGIRSKNS